MFCKKILKCSGNVAVTLFENVLKYFGVLSASLNLTLQHLIKHNMICFTKCYYNFFFKYHSVC